MHVLQVKTTTRTSLSFQSAKEYFLPSVAWSLSQVGAFADVQLLVELACWGGRSRQNEKRSGENEARQIRHEGASRRTPPARAVVHSGRWRTPPARAAGAGVTRNTHRPCMNENAAGRVLIYSTGEGRQNASDLLQIRCASIDVGESRGAAKANEGGVGGGCVEFANAEKLILQETQNLRQQELRQTLSPQVLANLNVQHTSRWEPPPPAVTFQFPHDRASRDETVRQLVHHAEFDRVERAPYALVPPCRHARGAHHLRFIALSQHAKTGIRNRNGRIELLLENECGPSWFVAE